MQTVQLQCGNCSNMMAISVEHLGAQVQCPHCSAVVQTPPRSALGPPPGPDPAGAAVQPQQYQPQQPPAYQPTPSVQVPERESIFSDPEPSDDLFGSEPSPRVQMPEPNYAVSQQPIAHQEDYQTTAVADEDEGHADLSAMRGRLDQHRKASNFAPMILVFLVPYAICTTGFIAYLLMTWPKLEALSWIPDPRGKGGARVVELPVHDLPVPAAQKTALNQPVRIGAIEVTPLKVAKNAAGDLILQFKAKNISSNQALVPIDLSFFADARPPKGGLPKSYTFLERKGVAANERVYGGDLEFIKGDKRNANDIELQPGQECVVELSTDAGEKTRNKVKALLANDGQYQWRIQVRRGLTPVYGVDTSLTAVIGIEFTGKDVGNAG